MNHAHQENMLEVQDNILVVIVHQEHIRQDQEMNHVHHVQREHMHTDMEIHLVQVVQVILTVVVEHQVVHHVDLVK